MSMFRGIWSRRAWSSSCRSRGRCPCCLRPQGGRRGTWRSTCCRRRGTPSSHASASTADRTPRSTLHATIHSLSSAFLLFMKSNFLLALKESMHDLPPGFRFPLPSSAPCSTHGTNHAQNIISVHQSVYYRTVRYWI
jgi:hypothetical protein